MFSLTIAFGETPAMWRLLFKTEEAARAAYSQLTYDPNTRRPSINAIDDFGQSCCANEIIGCMLEDLNQSKIANVEMMLHNARTQAQAQIQARSEPALRQAGGGGPGVFVPNMGNGRLS